MRNLLTKSIVSIAAILIMTGEASAQKQVKVGFIKDSSTLRPLANVLITNEYTHKLTHTDSAGFFRIEAREKDILFFDAQDYHFDTLRYGRMTPDTVTVYLAHLPNVLAGVTVTARGYTKYQQDSIKRRLDFEKDAGPKMNTVAKSNSGAGVGINLDALLKKSDKGRRKAYKTFDEIEKTNYVAARYSRDMVSGYTGLTGDSLSTFIEKTRPSYDWLRQHTTDDDVFYYVNDKLKGYMQIKQQ
jgi:hypothetical protein